MAATLMIYAFWDVTTCNLVSIHQTLGHHVTEGCNFICPCPWIFRQLRYVSKYSSI